MRKAGPFRDLHAVAVVVAAGVAFALAFAYVADVAALTAPPDLGVLGRLRNKRCSAF